MWSIVFLVAIEVCAINSVYALVCIATCKMVFSTVVAMFNMRDWQDTCRAGLGVVGVM